MNDDQHWRAVLEITDLEHRYARFLDFGPAEAAAELFTPDGVYENEAERFIGQAVLAAHWKELGARPEVLRHVVTNVVVDVIDDHHATSTSYLMYFSAKPAEGIPIAAYEDPVVLGHYENRLVRTGAGWRFESKSGRVEMVRPDLVDIYRGIAGGGLDEEGRRKLAVEHGVVAGAVYDTAESVPNQADLEKDTGPPQRA